MSLLNNYLNKSIKKKIYLLKRFCSTETNKSIKKNKWKSVVGLEIHAQIATKSKLFSGAETKFAAPVNSCVSLFDAAIPGTLPVLNRHCVEAAVKTALALSCKINKKSMFDRKHYFYADLPAGYQITQQRAALANKGVLTFPVFISGKKPYHKSVRLHQLQLEQDSGKSLHDTDLGRSLVDLNRAGMPLMELVFEPDLSDGEEAASMVKELILILSRLDTCSCKMEEGALRVDANISINKPGEPLGTRTEIKNIGSVRGVAQAVNYEIQRQIELKNSNGVVTNETRSWDAEKRITVLMRDKEVQQDYRFMPEPNLPPLLLNVDDTLPDNNKTSRLINVSNIKNLLPEMPETTRQKLINNYNLPQEISIIMVNESKLLNYFFNIFNANPVRKTKLIGNILVNELLTVCNKNKIQVDECKITGSNLGFLIDMVENQTINLVMARQILNEMINDFDANPIDIANKNNWKQINDKDELTKMCNEILLNNEKLIKQYKSGKKKILFAIAGDIARKTEQRANMVLVTEILKDILEK